MLRAIQTDLTSLVEWVRKSGAGGTVKPSIKSHGCAKAGSGSRGQGQSGRILTLMYSRPHTHELLSLLSSRERYSW